MTFKLHFNNYAEYEKFIEDFYYLLGNDFSMYSAENDKEIDKKFNVDLTFQVWKR